MVATVSRATELKNKLRTLADQAGTKHFERAKIATELLADEEWIDAEFDGDGKKARDTIEAEFFHDLAGTVRLSMLIDIYHTFPTVGEWKAHGFRLMDMAAIVIERRKGERHESSKPRAAVKVAEYRELQQKLEHAEAVNKQQSELMDATKREFKTELQRLREENERLREEVARLKGRIEEMQSRYRQLQVA